MGKTFFIVGTLIFISFQAAIADRGGVPYNPAAVMFEPNQSAVICWNGSEELLILTTDLRSSVPTKVLEVTVFPAEPKVTKGDITIFKKTVDFINRKRRSVLVERGEGTLSLGGKSLAPAEPAGAITFQEKIGAHDISVARVLNTPGFIEWVKNYLKESGVEIPTIPPALEAVVGDYMNEGYRWFSFDVVSLDSTTKTNDAIKYRFKTGELYYPLKISRSAKGDTYVRLLVISDGLLNTFFGIPKEKVRLLHIPVNITHDELWLLDEEMEAMLAASVELKIRIWQINGDISKFDDDLLAK